MKGLSGIGALVLGQFLLTACGGGGSSSDGSPPVSEPSTSTGRFIDSPVANIGYRTESIPDGVTNANGQFKYLEGETVTFFIGDLEFPPAPATEKVTPLDLAGSTDTSDPTVINIIRLLQSLDDDGITSTGITINQLAKDNATPVDFFISESEFQNLTAVKVLVENSGSPTTSLISTSEALEHFEGILVGEGVEFVANLGINGIWVNENTDNELLAFVFFRDGTYVHLEVDEELPLDEQPETSGMEWGTYSLDPETRALTVDIDFDRNLDTGLTSSVNGGLDIFARVSGDQLTFEIDENGNSSIDDGESTVFSRSASETMDELVGIWKVANVADFNDTLALIFFADGTYVHMEIDEQAPFDEQPETSGMEWGTYSVSPGSDAITFTGLFDNNGDTGPVNGVGSPSTISASISDTSIVFNPNSEEPTTFLKDPATQPRALAFTESELQNLTWYAALQEPEDCGPDWLVEETSFDGTSYTLDLCGTGTDIETGSYEVLSSGVIFWPGFGEYIARKSFDSDRQAFYACSADTELAALECPASEQFLNFLNKSDAEAYVAEQNANPELTVSWEAELTAYSQGDLFETESATMQCDSGGGPTVGEVGTETQTWSRDGTEVTVTSDASEPGSFWLLDFTQSTLTVGKTYQETEADPTGEPGDIFENVFDISESYTWDSEQGAFIGELAETITLSWSIDGSESVCEYTYSVVATPQGTEAETSAFLGL